MLKFTKFLIVAIIFFLTLGKPSGIDAVNYNLTGKWNWTDTTSGFQNYFGVATIDHNGTTLTLTWQWKDQNNSQWNGTGFTANTAFSLDGTYNNGQLTAHWDGEVLDSGNKLQGTWTQSDRQHGTFIATRITPPVPYFSQIDPQWGSQEYDHANSLDLNCGTTIAQCGCAVTSAAMILKYYGIDKSPDGPSTTPESLNNWLKTNKGYVNGDLNWLAIASYSKKTHDKFGTQIVDYLGRVKSANFTLLNEDLSQNRPVILQEPGHFIMATGIQGSTYSINDPRWTSKTTLQAYGNTFQEMRRYAKANTDLSGLLISTTSFTEFLVIDSQGRKTGKDPVTGQIYEEVPNSSYYLQTPLTNDTFENPLPPPENSGNFFFEALDPEAGNYFILVHSPNRNSTVTFLGYDQNAEVSEQIRTISELTEYVLNYSSEPGTQIQVAEIDVDIKPDSDPNSINLKNNGVIPVAILTTPSFDATQVNVSTIKFGPNQATEIHNKGHLEDMDNDGDVDLMLHFKTQDTGIQNTDSQACLTGATLNGIPIQGCDSIRIVTE